MDQELVNTANPAQPLMEQDSATTKAEKLDRHGVEIEGEEIVSPSVDRKRAQSDNEGLEITPNPAKRQKGVAPIKPESVHHSPGKTDHWLN